METPENQKRMTAPRVAAIVLLIFAIFCIIYLIRGTMLSSQLSALDLIPKPEHFTELYFENSTALPTSTIAGKPISFAFTIRNQEGTSTVYPYVVYIEYPTGERVVLASSSVTLNNDASTTIPITHIFKSSGEQCNVFVDLTAIDQKIDFLLPDNN
jgi:hypothetical protein